MQDSIGCFDRLRVEVWKSDTNTIRSDLRTNIFISDRIGKIVSESVRIGYRLPRLKYNQRILPFCA